MGMGWILDVPLHVEGSLTSSRSIMAALRATRPIYPGPYGCHCQSITAYIGDGCSECQPEMAAKYYEDDYPDSSPETLEDPS